MIGRLVLVLIRILLALVSLASVAACTSPKKRRLHFFKDAGFDTSLAFSEHDRGQQMIEYPSFADRESGVSSCKLGPGYMYRVSERRLAMTFC